MFFIIISIVSEAEATPVWFVVCNTWRCAYNFHWCAYNFRFIVYKSPQFEAMVFGLVLDQLVTIGYPSAIRDFEYDPTFVVR